MKQPATKDYLEGIVVGMVITSLAIALLAARFSYDQRIEFIKNTGSGIELGYLCHQKGWSEEQCKTDFRNYMAGAK